MKKIEAVIFDMDGLIFDTETLYYRANQEIADEIGLDFTYDYYLQYVGTSDEELHENLYRDFDDEKKVAHLIQEGRKRVEEIVKRDGLIIKEGFMDLLNYLEEKNIKKVVASSNLKEMIHLFIEREKLTGRFDYIVSGDEVKRAKPDPEIFEKAWSGLGIAKENTLILEDSINGIRAAFDAGIDVIMIPDLIPPGEEALEKTLKIYDDLTIVKAYIDQQNKN